MSSTLKYLRALSDPTRLRIIALLEKDELSVNELQEITRMGQSRISTHLGLLQDSGLLESRREGKRTFYKISPLADELSREFVQLAIRGAKELPEASADQLNLKRIIPPITVADLGSGEGLLSELLARRAKKVIAVDNSEKMVAFGAAKAKKNKLKNLEFRLGQLENPPIDPNSVDLVVLSQALHHAPDPEQAIRSAYNILRPGGQIMILDLMEHSFDKASELYGDRWLGFPEGTLHRWLETVGFKNIEVTVV